MSSECKVDQLSPNEIVISFPFDTTFSHVSQAIQRLGTVKEQNRDQQFIEGRVKYGFQSVKVRASLVEREHGKTNVVIQASSDDVWGAGSRNATKRLVETLCNLDSPGYRPDRLGMQPAGLVGVLIGFVLVLLVAIGIGLTFFKPSSLKSLFNTSIPQSKREEMARDFVAGKYNFADRSLTDMPSITNYTFSADGTYTSSHCTGYGELSERTFELSSGRWSVREGRYSNTGMIYYGIWFDDIPRPSLLLDRDDGLQFNFSGSRIEMLPGNTTKCE